MAFVRGTRLLMPAPDALCHTMHMRRKRKGRSFRMRAPHEPHEQRFAVAMKLRSCAYCVVSRDTRSKRLTHTTPTRHARRTLQSIYIYIYSYPRRPCHGSPNLLCRMMACWCVRAPASTCVRACVCACVGVRLPA